ncbi:MAG TPA: dienelactone hydrolase family protein [Nitrososphaerales archaeon]|nr:dienelactone hydrolase family protein [Nitrososphaerales archaeon]
MTLLRTPHRGWDFYVSRGKSEVGVVVVHEIYGLLPYLESVANQLAGAGITAAAVDLFRGKVASSVEEGIRFRQSLVRTDLLDAIAKGIELIKQEPGVKKVGAMGFCMGGGFALQSACDLGADFCVDYYGMIENEEDVSKLKGPTLLILAGKDERINPWAFQKFLPAAMKYGKRVELELYPDTRHGFHRPGWEGHDPSAAENAWDRTIRFISELKSK